MKRRTFLFRASTALAVTLTGCGGSSEATDVGAGPSPNPTPTPTPNPTPTPTPTPSPPSTPWTPSGPGLPTLTLHPAQSGTFPYIATAYPLEGAVPAGQTVESPDDPNLSASVLSAWPDGSAAVIVLAGETAVTSAQMRNIGLRAAAKAANPLGAARVSQLVTSVGCNFGAAGSASLNDFSSPERVWWANDRVICARYRLPIGGAGLEAVIDIHAFASNRAFVEVIVENGRVDADAATVVAPGVKTYSNATVSVNGGTIATVSSPTAAMPFPNARRSGNYAGGHESFRAWYCSTWVGGDPGIEVTHDSATLQNHPWFFRAAEASAENLQQKYSQAHDSYVPWALGRLRMPGMDGTGDDEEIGLFTECQTDYFLSGNRQARRAVVASGLACLSAGFNWRHTNGQIPSQAQVAAKNTSNGRWPLLTTEPRWGGSNTSDGSHIPAIGLVPFLCQPSPCFIEIAQKEFVWNHTNYNSVDGSHPFDQTRSRAWRLRNYAIAAFLTPDADGARKAGYRLALVNSMNVVNAFLNKSWNTFQALYDLTADDPGDHSTARAGFQTSFFMHHFCSQSFHSVAGAKVLRGAEATAWNTMTDRMMAFPLRWINDATAFEWRAIPYQPTIGVRTGTAVTQSTNNLVALTRTEMSGTMPSSPGPWMTLSPSQTNWSSLPTENRAGTTYPSWFFAALAAAVERGVPGSASAWDKVVTNGGISNLAAWLQGYRTAPRFNRWPRNK